VKTWEEKMGKKSFGELCRLREEEFKSEVKGLLRFFDDVMGAMVKGLKEAFDERYEKHMASKRSK
jgi:hypothetical protein